MIEQKEKQVLGELMQFGYDRNVIALVDMRGNNELEKLFGELTKTVINSCWDWFNSSNEQYEEETKYRTNMRFCFTAGLGAAWFWENKIEDVQTKGLYVCLTEPRTIYEMDEYIEDVTGIWWSSNSLDHYKHGHLSRDLFEIIRKYYDLTDKVQEYTAGHVLMLFGMYYGYTRIYLDKVRESYNGKTTWHWEVWESLYGKSEDENLEEYNDWARKAITDGKAGLGEDVVLKNPNSEFGMINKYYRQFTYNGYSGIRTLLSLEDKHWYLHTATPVFDTTRSYNLVIDRVYVWGSGVEATIKAHFSDDEDFEVVFYDTNYLENKDRYFAGLSYIFDLYAIAYQTEAVPEDQFSFFLKGDDAVNFKKKLGQEPEYDENGNPKPIEFDTANMHSFLQIDDDTPENASFRAPIKAVYKDIDFLGKRVYEVEIGLPHHDTNESGNEYPLSVYIAAETDNKPINRPVEGTPIHGLLYLQGKMRRVINMQEIPSTILHTFEAQAKDGTMNVFSHICAENEVGQLMSEQEKYEFAKEVYYQNFSKRIEMEKVESEGSEMPDFYSTRSRDIWIKADSNYCANDDFIQEKKNKYLVRGYGKGRFPVIAYISLYDVVGKECQWLKGGRYTAKIHYGSVFPGQKMEIMGRLNHDDLVMKLFESYKDLDTRVLSRYLHKDLDFRSINLADPIITRDEYLIRTDAVNENNKKAKEGPVKPIIVNSDEGSYIQLEYPKGAIDVVKVKTNAGFITSIKIENIRE